jgi:hypothetical protein
MAFEEAVNQGLQYVILEGDSNLLIQAILRQDMEVDWEIKSIIAYIKNLLTCFVIWVVSFVNISGNSMAYNLAPWSSLCIAQGANSIPPILITALVVFILILNKMIYSAKKM